jgi:hypothetical protein
VWPCADSEGCTHVAVSGHGDAHLQVRRRGEGAPPGAHCHVYAALQAHAASHPEFLLPQHQARVQQSSRDHPRNSSQTGVLYCSSSPPCDSLRPNPAASCPSVRALGSNPVVCRRDLREVSQGVKELPPRMGH